MNIRNVLSLLKSDKAAFCAGVVETIGFLLPDRPYLELLFQFKMKHRLNLKNPRTYSEKLQWLKLYDRNPLYTKLVDKFEVKEYVSDIIGGEFIIPTLGVWDSPDEISFDELPDRFVLKCTHDSGGLVICKDKKTLNRIDAKNKLRVCLKRNFYSLFREWPYKNVKRRIIAEKYMEDSRGELNDFKFFCFDGRVECLFIASERQNSSTETKFDFFDRNFNHLPFTNGHPNASVPPDKPHSFEQMVTLAEKLSKGFPHVRVDFYEINDKIYFGELTFFHWSGLVPFVPEEWDYKLGSWLKLPEKRHK